MRRIDHTAAAVRDLDAAIDRYTRLYGVQYVERYDVPDQGVKVAFLTLGDTRLELITPLHDTSGVARFIEKRGEGLHHIGVQVDNLEDELARLGREGAELIDHEPRRGPHGPVAFVHPRSTGGVLVELVQHDEP